MSSPKKKLPTGPIRINPPVTHQVETSAPQTQSRAEKKPNPEEETATLSLESQKQDSGLEDDSLLEASMEKYALIEADITEKSKPNSSSQGLRLQEAAVEQLEQEESTQMGVTPQSGSPDSGLPESGLTETEYKKVAMRLSSEAVDTLRQLRATTGVPYEILVDVMIRNWDKLPQRTRAAYLQQAKQVRGERLIAGQEKTMKTIRTKYLSH